MPRIDKLFQYLIENKGSDLHLEEGQKPKIRCHGDLVEIYESEVLSDKIMKNLMSEIVDPAQWDIFKQRGDIDFAYSMGDTARFRSNYYRHFGGMGAVFRTIPTKILSLDELNAPLVLKNIAQLHSGLVLVTGPTGSGKSTTLAAIVNHINETTNQKIITLEEPLEFIHSNKQCLVIHREIGAHTNSFQAGLSIAMKSDANVILVGELRDRDTIELACSAAELGILVFGTLHTNSAAKTVDRIVDVFPAKKKNQIRSALASSLKVAVSQQLLRTTDGTGRVAAYEILLSTPALPAIIRSGDTSKLNGLIQTGSKDGMISMDDSLWKLVSSNSISPETAHMKALLKPRFAALLKEVTHKRKLENEKTRQKKAEDAMGLPNWSQPPP